MNTSIDAARVELMLAELRLPTIRLIWKKLAAQADKEGWPAARFLAALAEHELAECSRRRIARHLAEARLPAGKTLASFDFAVVPMLSKAQIMALAAGGRRVYGHAGRHHICKVCGALGRGVFVGLVRRLAGLAVSVGA